MKTIVVSGGQSNIGKTALVLALCELLPGAQAVKLGHGTENEDKPGAFYRAGIGFDDVAAHHPQAAWLVIESNRILEQYKPDLAIYLPSDTPKSSAQMAFEKADLIRGVPVNLPKLSDLAGQLDLDLETIRKICWLAGARPRSTSITLVSSGAEAMAGSPTGLSTVIMPWFDTLRTSVSIQKIFAPDDLGAGGDGRPGPGPMMTLGSVLNKTDKEVNFIWATDIPTIDYPLMFGLLSLSEGYDIVVPSYAGYIEPLFGVYNKSVHEKVGPRLATLQGRLSDIFPICKTLIVPVQTNLRA